MDFISRYSSPLGGITIASDGVALKGLWFDGQKFFADNLSDDHEERSLTVFDEMKKWLDIYFSGKAPDFTPPLRIEGTVFRRAVWEILLTIPFGRTMTYGKIAELISKQNGLVKMSAQAVGNAVGHNPISIIIPCHRVIGANGNLTGYAAGTDKKLKLLELEHADLSSLSGA